MRLHSIALATTLAPLLAIAGTAPLPDGFGLVPRHETARAVWSTMAGESPGAWNRTVIERTCAAKRSIGATTHTPVFEADPDRPNAVRIVQVVSAQSWASYETVQGAMCDASTLRDDLCACTFRSTTSHYMHLRKTRDGVTEVIDVDFAKGSATRRTRRAGAASAASAPSVPDLGFFGAVVGHDTIAGMPCSLHRQVLGSGHIDRCLADAVPQVPEALRLQELSTTTFLLEDGEAVRRDWRRTESIDANADVDLGVFDVPSALTVRDLGGVPARP